eukprot:1588997-Rhodomonas_salina.1
MPSRRSVWKKHNSKSQFASDPGMHAFAFWLMDFWLPQRVTTRIRLVSFVLGFSVNNTGLPADAN